MTKVKNSMLMEYYGQHADSQSNRTNYTPGKASSSSDEMNWSKDFRVPVAGWNTKFHFQRTAVLGRMSVSDSEIEEPVIIGEKPYDKDWVE